MITLPALPDGFRGFAPKKYSETTLPTYRNTALNEITFICRDDVASASALEGALVNVTDEIMAARGYAYWRRSRCRDCDATREIFRPMKRRFTPHLYAILVWRRLQALRCFRRCFRAIFLGAAYRAPRRCSLPVLNWRDGRDDAAGAMAAAKRHWSPLPALQLITTADADGDYTRRRRHAVAVICHDAARKISIRAEDSHDLRFADAARSTSAIAETRHQHRFSTSAGRTTRPRSS